MSRVHGNGEPKANRYRTDSYDEAFKGSPEAFARHLVDDHGFDDLTVAPFRVGIDQGSWDALLRLHREARGVESAPVVRSTNPGQSHGLVQPRVSGNGITASDTTAKIHAMASERPFEGTIEDYKTHLILDCEYTTLEVERAVGDTDTQTWLNFNRLRRSAQDLAPRTRVDGPDA